MSDDPIKDTLRMMPYGFYAITSRTDTDLNAMVANWVSQISFEPRLVALALQKTSHSYDLVKEGGVFTINLFRTEDADYLKGITKGRSKNPDKMKDANYEPAPVTGCPVLEGAAAYLELEVVNFVDVGGDHDLVIGSPVGAGVLKEGEAADILNLPALGWSYAG